MRSVRFLAVAALAAGAAAVRADDSSPATQLKATMAAVAKGDAKALLNSMPKSYRDDAQGLVRDAVKKIDPEVWNKGFGVAKSALKVLKGKKDLLLEMVAPFTGGAVPADDMAKIYDTIIAVVEAPIASDLANHSSAASLDMDAWSVDVGGKMLKTLGSLDVKTPDGKTVSDMLKSLGDAKIEVVEVKGDTATVKVEVPGQPPSPEVKMKKVDGVWFFADVTDKWAENMQKAKDGLAKVDFAGTKDKTLKAIAEIESALVSIDAAKDAGGLTSAIQAAGEKLKPIFGR